MKVWFGSSFKKLINLPRFLLAPTRWPWQQRQQSKARTNHRRPKIWRQKVQSSFSQSLETTKRERQRKFIQVRQQSNFLWNLRYGNIGVPRYVREIGTEKICLHITNSHWFQKNGQFLAKSQIKRPHTTRADCTGFNSNSKCGLDCVFMTLKWKAYFVHFMFQTGALRFVTPTEIGRKSVRTARPRRSTTTTATWRRRYPPDLSNISTRKPRLGILPTQTAKKSYNSASKILSDTVIPLLHCWKILRVRIKHRYLFFLRVKSYNFFL